MTEREDNTPVATNSDGTSTPFLIGPTGFGTSAARLADQINRARAADLDPRVARVDIEPAYAERSWGDGTASPLYCPVTERINEPLADVVDERLAAWAQNCGFDDDEVEKIRKVRFGRLAMLAHADSDDVERLLIGAKMNAAWWAADDYYADDTALGAAPERLPPRLVLAMATMDPLPPVGEFTQPLEEALSAERVLVALRSGLDHMARYATPEQVQRTCYATFAMFVSWSAYAAWRFTGEYPPAWKYLAARQHDSFYTSMTLIDVIGGYTLAADLFYEPRVRHAAFQAGTATALVNDLLSVAKDMAEEKPPCNMVLQVAADRGCSIQQATEITVNLHNDLVREFQASHRALQAIPHLELQRFLRGLRAWMGGAFEWHNSNPRYRTDATGS
jgi:2-methylisoborneol synthase